MTQRTDYLIQILDKIGAPLMGAVAAVPTQGGAESDSSDAQTIASLLGKVVEVSIAMNESMDLSAADAQDDSLRAALAALAGPLVAGQYKQHKHIPSENELKRLQASIQAVLTFADNFIPSEDHVKRLEQIEAGGQAMDAHQVNIQYVHAFIPVINAVAAFSFGQPEQKLVMDISDRLVKRAVEMREALMSGLGGDDQKLAELSILRGLSGIYAACHVAETQRLSAMKDEDLGASTLEPVWKSFDTRSAMLEAVVKNILPDGGGAPSGAKEAAPMSPIAAVIADPPATAAAPATPPGGEAPLASQPAEAPSAPPSGGGNPMAFFGAPKGDTKDEAAPPAEPAAVPDPAPPAPEPPAAAAPPSSDDDTSGESKGESSNSGGNPMSFFTKKDEEG